jgi:hypothetical protein
VQDWELKSLLGFMELLYSILVRVVGSNKICWKPAKRVQFSVGNYFSIFSRAIETSFPWKVIWKSWNLTWVAFSVWTAALGKILTIDNLCWRHFVVLNWCCMCKHDGESTDHLLLHYSVAQEMWSMPFGLFGVSWVMPKTVLGLLDCWQGKFGRHQNIGFGGLCLIASCGAFGGNIMIVALRILRGLLWT